MIMNMRKIVMAVMVAAAVTSCKGPGGKTLILYYSQTGTTEALAAEIQRQTGADVCRFDVGKAYDGTYEETIERCLEERRTGFVPELKPLGVDVSGYDVIFLGFPVWFGTYAMPVKSLLMSMRSDALEGKTIVPFCTFGSGGLQASTEDLRAALPGCDVRDGYGVRTARIAEAPQELNRFLIENGWKKGSIEPLPAFSGEVPVTEETAAIFDAACSGYKYPIGTPVAVGERDIPGGKEYKFAAESFTPDGRLSHVAVFVNVIEGQSPVFTQVVR